MIIEGLKSHGSGNDFLIIDELTTTLTFTEEERKNFAKALCNQGKARSGWYFVCNEK